MKRGLVDEKPRLYRRWLALVWLPLALLIVVPVVILLGVSYYVRALVIGMYGMARFLLGYKPPLPPSPTQPPHLFDIPASTKEILDVERSGDS